MRTRRIFSFVFSFAGGGIFALVAFGAPAKPGPARPDAPPSLGVSGTGFSFTLPDPKRPGRLLYDLRAESAAGQSQADGFHGTLTTVWAKLFQGGVPAATLTAPRALGSSVRGSTVITGLGGVAVKSLTEPGTLLTADTVVWYASTNKITATGHVYYHDGKTGATMRGPRAVGDSRLKTLTISAGHGTARL